MDEDLEITGATAGDIHYVVAYYDVNTNNLYNANGQLYGNSTFSTTLGNEFILELHYVQDISTSDNPDNWTAWEGLSGMTVSSTLAFDDNYVHAVEATVAESVNAGSPTVKINVPDINKDTLNASGNLIFNPFGIEPEDVQQDDPRPVKQIVSYTSFNYISGTVFEFDIEDAQGLPLNVVGGDNPTPVRVSDPLYLFIGTDAIYEKNIPERYNEGVFKFPMNINSRKLLRAMDYSGVSGVSGTMEHNIYVERNVISGMKIGTSTTYVRDSSGDRVAIDSSDGNTYRFYKWTNLLYTKGTTDIHTGNGQLYAISSGGTASLQGTTITEVLYDTDSVLFRTFAFPFIVKNLVDYGNTITIPVENTDWTKDYIISIIRNNMEIVVGKASTASYGTVMVSNDGTIDVDDGVISIATSLATKQDNMSAIAPVAINNSTVSLNIGDGLAVGVTGTTNANKLIVNEASVKEVLEDVVDGGTEPAVNEIVTADNLRGALSVGQAVDVSCAPVVSGGTATVDGVPLSDNNFYGTITWSVSNFTGSPSIGWTYTNPFPKFANGLKYLVIADIKNISGTTAPLVVYPSGNPAPFSGGRHYLNSGESFRGYAVYTSSTYLGFYLENLTSSNSYQLELKNYRVYEVTALTDEAIAYIAQLPDPDAFFRSTSAYSIRDKYLIKQDMVCPFIPTINMPDNSDLTVAAGLSYKIKYTNDNTHTITADTIPTDAYGWDTHIQMFIKGTSAINFQAPLVLEDPLTPNAGHNMTIKWRNGQALVYVDDTDVGYIVTVTAGTENGSLYYGLTNDVGGYITFANTTDGSTIEKGGTITRNLSIIGNGIDNTELNAYITTALSSIKFSMFNLSISATTDILKIQNFNGSEFANCRFHDTAGNGNKLNLIQGSNKIINCIFDNLGSDNPDSWAKGDVVYSFVNATTNISGCTFTNIKKTMDVIATYSNNGTINVSNCYFNNPQCFCGILLRNTTFANISGSTFASTGDTIKFGTTASGSKVTFSGTNILNSTVSGAGQIAFAAGATVTSTDGNGTINLAGSTNRLTFNLEGNKTYTIDNLTITNWNSSEGLIITSGNQIFNFNNCVITGNTATNDYGIIRVYNQGNTFNFYNVTIDTSKGIGSYTAFLRINSTSIFNFEECSISNAVICSNGNPQINLIGTNNLIGSEAYINGVTINISGILDLHLSINSIAFSNKVIIGYIHIDNNTIIKFNSNVNCTIDGISCNIIANDGIFSSLSTDYINLIVDSMELWSATNAIFGSPLDATEADTIKLSGTTFTATAKTLNANRIQLPASTTVSFQGNTNPTDTKILDAGLIVVGDKPASPSGSATIVNASGTSSTVTGIGTYIDKEGDNDFTAITNITAVTTNASSGTGSLNDALTASNRFIKIADGVTGSIGGASGAGIYATDKHVITHDYEPIIGGTIYTYGCTIDEATKTVNIPSGGRMDGASITICGIVHVGAGVFRPNLAIGKGSGTVTIDSEVQLNTSTLRTLTINGTGGIVPLNNATVTIADCDVKTGLVMATTNAGKYGNFVLSGNCKITRIFNGDTTKTGSVTLSDNAVIDITGSTDTNTIFPANGGFIIIGSSVSIIYDNGGTAEAKTATFSGNISDIVAIGYDGKMKTKAQYGSIATNLSLANMELVSDTGSTPQTGYNVGTGNTLTLTNVTITRSSQANVVAMFIGNGGTINLVNCTLNNGTNILQHNASGAINISGTLTLHQNGLITQWAGFTQGQGGSVVIANNTKIDFYDCTAHLNNAPAIATKGTITFGSNVQIRKYNTNTWTLLNGGVAGTCTEIWSNGTIV